MGIETSYYTERRGLRGIVRISSDWHEKQSGYQDETTTETICYQKDDRFWSATYVMSMTFAPRSGGASTSETRKVEISEADYLAHREKVGILDTEDYYAALSWAKKRRPAIEEEMETVRQHCPTCGDAMVRRTSSYGEFMGCSNYPRCKGKAKVDHEAERKLQEFNRELRSLQS